MTPSPRLTLCHLRANATIQWSELMKRVFLVDVLQCERCGGHLKILAAIHSPDLTGKILECLSLPYRAPPLATAVSDFTGQMESF